MRFALTHLEHDFYYWIESIDSLSREITPSVKNQTIDPGGEIFAF